MLTKPNPGKCDSTEALLSERSKTHGKFGFHAEITWALKDMMECRANWMELRATEKEALCMIAHKIGRILAGNPHFADHWADIAGYAKLVADELTSTE